MADKISFSHSCLLLSICFAVGSAASLNACNIPVFRYALERWEPDAVEVLVFYQGQLSAKDAAIVDRLSAQCGDSEGHANAKLIRVDVAQAIDPARADLWSSLRESEAVTLPQVLVRTKLGRGRFINHWHGTPAKAEQFGLFRSPARAEIRDRLLAGHSVVWILIQSGDREKNERAKQIAEETFKTLEDKVQLPEGIGLPGSELYADIPLVLRFSVLEINPHDPKEAFLVGLLTGLRLQAFEEGEPLLVPVFGRGRALEVIPGRDMSPRLMEELTIFLSGACSCQVKEQNPGFDLLIDADWDAKLFGDIENRPPDRSAEEGQNRNPVLVPIPRGRK